MTIDLHETFEKFNDEYLKFERINEPLNQRPDICAFLYLDKLFPAKRDIVTASEHDEFFLDIDCEEFAKIATDEQVIYLLRCGVHYDSDTDSLAMFA